MMRKRLGLAMAAAGLMVLPAGVAAAQETEPHPCFSEGDGSIIGEPSPCPTETVGQPEVPEPTDEPPEEEASAQPVAQEAGLADTGADAGVLAFAALGALGLGAAAVVASRGRQRGR